MKKPSAAKAGPVAVAKKGRSAWVRPVMCSPNRFVWMTSVGIAFRNGCMLTTGAGQLRKQQFTVASKSTFAAKATALKVQQQSAHAIVESVPYSPTGHIVQIVAPLLASVSVNDPAAHTLHASVELSLNWPAAHAVQLTAPRLVSVSVIEPGVHTEQLTWPSRP